MHHATAPTFHTDSRVALRVLWRPLLVALLGCGVLAPLAFFASQVP